MNPGRRANEERRARRETIILWGLTEKKTRTEIVKEYIEDFSPTRNMTSGYITLNEVVQQMLKSGKLSWSLGEDGSKHLTVKVEVKDPGRPTYPPHTVADKSLVRRPIVLAPHPTNPPPAESPAPAAGDWTLEMVEYWIASMVTIDKDVLASRLTQENIHKARQAVRRAVLKLEGKT